MQTLGSPASVIASIREDADAETERIHESAEAELEAIRAESASARVAVEDREERLAAARQANEERAAKQQWDARCATLEHREKWIQRVVTAGQQRWSRDGGARLNALVREALSRMPAGQCEVAVREADRELVEVGEARVSTAVMAGGCIVTSGEVSFDNSFEARARRLEPEWRSALSRMFTP